MLKFKKKKNFLTLFSRKVFFEGTSVQKSTKLASAGSLLANLTWLCPNLRELIAIYYSTQTSHYLHHNEEKKESERGSEYQTEKRILESCKSLQEYLSKGTTETLSLSYVSLLVKDFSLSLSLFHISFGDE